MMPLDSSEHTGLTVAKTQHKVATLRSPEASDSPGDEAATHSTCPCDCSVKPPALMLESCHAVRSGIGMISC